MNQKALTAREAYQSGRGYSPAYCLVIAERQLALQAFVLHRNQDQLLEFVDLQLEDFSAGKGARRPRATTVM